MFKNEAEERRLYESEDSAEPKVTEKQRLTDMRKRADAFKFDQKVEETSRAAIFLNQISKTAPGQFCPQNIVLKACKGGSRVPKMDSAEVELFRRKSTKIEALLRDSFGQTLVSLRGEGWRASISSDDAVENRLAKQIKGLEAKKVAVEKTMGTITPSKLKPANRKWWHAVGEAVRGLNENKELLSLLPKPEEVPTDATKKGG